ncbi:MAG: succinylglutamate desuccinylase/aspartoacylase family protein [Sulfitobacter sp.]
MIALDQPGLTSGYAHFHNSTDKSAWQSVRLPIHCLNGTDGPTTLILGGMHGDEYEGPVAIDALAHAVDTEALVGRLILLPALNLPAVMAGTRLTPDDGLNLNRVFPGDPLGSITQRIAHWLSETMMPLSDHIIDLHSGGRTLNFAPSILIPEASSQVSLAKAVGMAFGAPFTVLIDEDHAPMTIDAVAEKLGKVIISSELGGAGMVTQHTATLATQGLARMVAALGHLPVTGSPPTSHYVRLPSPDKYLICDDDMIFVPTVNLGDAVHKGGIIGHGRFIDRIDVKPRAYVAPHDGWVLCLGGQGLSRRGDVVAVVAQDAS